MVKGVRRSYGELSTILVCSLSFCLSLRVKKKKRKEERKKERRKAVE